MKGVVSIGVFVLGLVGAGVPSCKNFEGSVKTDAGAVDLVEAGAGSGGVSSGPGGTTNGAGGTAVGTGGTVMGAGGTNAGSGGAITGTGGAAPGTGGAGGGAPGCTPSQHLCSGTCVDKDSINTCGTQCDACKPPTGATATCDGATCDFTCGANMKKCATAAICVAAAGCCASADCPMQTSGQTGTCDSGTHLCNYGCPANTKACTVGGTTSCLPSSGCCQDSDCPGECQTCSVSTHTCVAAVSKDDPNGRCAGTCDAAGSCKSKRGQTCKTSSNGCVTGSTCSGDGYCCDTACTASCMACDLTGKLGTCSPVPSGPPHGARTACSGTGTTCGGACGNRTDGACVFPSGNCGSGPSCTSAGATGQGTCSGGSCLTPAAMSCTNGCNAASSACLSCAAGQTGCSGACKTLSTDAQNCGSCGRVCAEPQLAQAETGTFGAATCTGSCGYSCNTNFMKCPGTSAVCQRRIYDFENGTTQGFYQRTDIPDLAHTVANSNVRAHGGSRSLALALNNAGGSVNLDLSLCSGASMRLPTVGRSLSLWFYVDGALDPSLTNSLTAGIWGCNTNFCDIISSVSLGDAQIQPKTWIQMLAPVIPADAVDYPEAVGFTFQGALHPNASVATTTTVYVDDVLLQ